MTSTFRQNRKLRIIGRVCSPFCAHNIRTPPKLLFHYIEVQNFDSKTKMEKFAELKKAAETVEIVDAHAHNIVAMDSTVPFLTCFSEASGDALSDVPHTINFKVNYFTTILCFCKFMEFGVEDIAVFDYTLLRRIFVVIFTEKTPYKLFCKFEI